MKRTTSHRIRYPINDLLIVSKGRWYKAFLVTLVVLAAYTIGSLHVFTSYAPPTGSCSVTSFAPPDIHIVQLPPDRMEAIVSDVSKRWDVDRDFAKAVVSTATAVSRRDFPRPEDVLAVVAIESGFNPRAENAGGYGLMQVQFNHHRDKVDSKTDLMDPLQNMKVGARILREYFEGVNYDPDSAVLAYQAGIGGLLNGGARADYLAKFKRERARFKRILST